jgi:cellobiose-specific phosphotransferase system component IIA
MSILTLDAKTFRSTEEILELVRRFEDCTLPRVEWTHASHLTVALWHILQYDWPEATARMRRGIKRYNAAHGIQTTPTGGYHETLTLFWLRAVRAFLEEGRNEARRLVRLANELIASADRSLPLAHYTRELLFSPDARANWVEPDLKPLDQLDLQTDANWRL